MMEFWRHVEGFFDILLTRNVMTEIAAVTVCLWVGWFVGATLRSRYQRRGITTPTALTWKYLASQGIVEVAPVVVAWMLVILAHGLLFTAHFDVTIMAQRASSAPTSSCAWAYSCSPPASATSRGCSTGKIASRWRCGWP